MSEENEQADAEAYAFALRIVRHEKVALIVQRYTGEHYEKTQVRDEL